MKYAKFIGAIKRAMKAKRLSLGALSRETGIELSFLSKILSGDRNPPPDSYIIKIAKVLDLNPDQLIVDVGRIPNRILPVIEMVVSNMEKIMSIMGDDTYDLADRALYRFFSTVEGQKWFNDHYPNQNKNLKNKSFIVPALEYFEETEEGKRWFENERRRLEKKKPELRAIRESFDKWPT